MQPIMTTSGLACRAWPHFTFVTVDTNSCARTHLLWLLWWRRSPRPRKPW